MSLPDLKKQDIFYADGIKGIARTQITKSFAYKLFYAISKTIPGDKFLIGTDFRNYSKELFNIICLAASHLHKEIYYAGEISYDIFQFQNTLGLYDGAIFISPQHGDAGWSGFKIFKRDNFEIEYESLKSLIASEVADYNPNDEVSNLFYHKLNLEKDYFLHIMKFFDPNNWKNFKIVINGGNGLGGIIFKKFLSQFTKVNVITINTEPNEQFPHHIPNPLVPNNSLKLIEKLREEKADLAISLDQDGNSLVFIDETGIIINPNHLSALLLKIISKKYPGSKVGFDLKQSIGLNKKAEEFGLVGIKLSSSFKLINRSLRDLELKYASESNGTYYYSDCNFSSSPIYTLFLILELLNETNNKLSQEISNLNLSTSLSWQNNFLLNEFVSWDDITYALMDIFPDATPDTKDGITLTQEGFAIYCSLYRKHFIQVYIEAQGDILLHEIENKIYSKLLNFGVFIGAQHEEVDVEILTSSNRDKFETLLNNLWFTWNPHYILPIIDMYGDGWRKNIPPEAIIANYGKEKLNQILESKQWELEQSLRLYYNYFKRTCFFENFVNKNQKFEKLIENPIAYFCMEFGLIDWMQIYSGGLGILAGDFVKQTSDYGIPLVAIGLFYHQGYLHQDFSPDGKQIEDYIHQDPMDFNLELVKNPDGTQLTIPVLLFDHIVKVRAWKQRVGMNNLYLLDTNFEDNEEWEDRLITGYLYGGDIENRIRQELVLAYGGMRLMHSLNINPSILHMNEGHSGFIIFEYTLSLMHDEKLDFETALKKAQDKLVFTNHTLKQAGNDIFDFLLFEKYLSSTAKELGVDIAKLFELGDDKTYSSGGFSMTIFGMRNAKVSNAVSKIHSVAAKKIWPQYNLVPVTNGVHMPTWVSTEIHELYDEFLGENWHLGCPFVNYENIKKIPKARLWNAHKIRKQKLIHSLNTELGLNLRDDVLTIAWSRRLAAYKRPDLLITDIERLKRIINNSSRPIQILIAGKSHPKDNIGKEILKRMNQCFASPEFHNKIEIIPGYNWQLARRMVSGADIWLNTPYRYEEASGTSGMKAAANGLIQFTTRDGWTDEVNWYKIGWEIPEDDSAQKMYEILENEILPLYYNINEGEYNSDWIDMMLNSMQMALKDFSTDRMVREYLEKIYSQIL